MKIRDISEIRLIERFAERIRLDPSVVVGPGDDAAVIKWTKDRYLLLTCDMLVEDVHFKLKEATPFGIGWKALGRNISDIAAMGGIPQYALVSIALNPSSPVNLADGIFKGIKAMADKFKVNIVGGDVSKSNKTMIDISVIGEVEKRNLVTRSGARAGDVIFVTGSIGGSIKGKHLSFIPRVEEARALVKNFKVNAMIDISDGLALDLWRILKPSSVGAKIYENTIPLSKDAGLLKKAITDGEDFELLFTMNVKEARRFMRTTLAKMKISVTLIGEVMKRGYGYKLVRHDGRIEDMKAKGYIHF